MTTQYWVYGHTAASWQHTAQWSGSTIPVADDIVVFDGRATTPPTSGMSDGETGTAAQCTYDLLHFRTDYSGGVGSAALPLICAPDRIIIEGSGTYHICVGQNDQNTGVSVPTVIINNKDAIVYLYSNCNDGTATAYFVNVQVKAASHVYIARYTADSKDCGCYVEDLVVSPNEGRSDRANVTIQPEAYKVASTAAGTITLVDGSITCDSMIGTVNMYGGTLQYGSDGMGSADCNIQTIKMYDGTFNWNPDDPDNDAYIANAEVHGGVFDASGSTNNDRTKYLGNGAGTSIYLYKGGTMKLNNGRGNINVHTAVDGFYNFGGLLQVDSNVSVTINNNAT